MYNTKQSYLDGVIKCYQPTNTTGGHHPVAFSEHFPATFYPLVKPKPNLSRLLLQRAQLALESAQTLLVGLLRQDVQEPRSEASSMGTGMGVFQKWYPIAGWFIIYNRKSHLWMDDLGLPPFQEMPIYGMMWAEYQPILQNISESSRRDKQS